MERTRKGISPLIAAVVLLAFTVAIASLGSDFFIGFAKEHGLGAERRGEDMMECSNVMFEIDHESVLNNTPDNVSLVVHNSGGPDLENLIITTFNDTEVVNGNATPDSVPSASFRRLSTNDTVSGGLEKIYVYSQDCPGMKSQIEFRDGEWVLVS